MLNSNCYFFLFIQWHFISFCIYLNKLFFVLYFFHHYKLNLIMLTDFSEYFTHILIYNYLISNNIESLQYCREILRQVTSLSLLMPCSVIFYLSSCRGLILFSLNSLLHWQRFCRIKYSNYCIECEQSTAHCTFLNHKAEYVGKISEAVITTKSMDSVFV